MKNIIFIIGMAISFCASAESVTVTSKINSLSTYGTYENTETSYRNTILIKVDSTTVGCENGFYISEDDNLTNPSMMTFLLSAFHANSDVRFSGYSDQLLSWNNGNVCRVNNLSLVK